jgi:hypothetical protein
MDKKEHKSAWDPVRWRKELTTQKIVQALSCFLPDEPETPPMPTSIAIEEAVNRLYRYERVLSEISHKAEFGSEADARGDEEIGYYFDAIRSLARRAMGKED